jgi:uncharacterized protein
MHLVHKYQVGVPCWIASAHPNPKQIANFYTELFDWAVMDIPLSGQDGAFLMCTSDGHPVAAIGPQYNEPELTTPLWNTYIWVENIREALRKVTEAGGTTLVEPLQLPHIATIAICTDTEGAVFGLWQATGVDGAQRINEPRAWSMSTLNTRNTEAAKKFYGSVFGWSADMADGAALWRLQGYTGGKPEQPVPRDVIGVMVDNPSAPPHWGIDLWVDDVDEATQKAVELGGNIIAPPLDGPFSRDATLADPQGAVFTISKIHNTTLN